MEARGNVLRYKVGNEMSFECDFFGIWMDQTRFDREILQEFDVIFHRQRYCSAREPKLVLINDVGLLAHNGFVRLVL